MKISTTKNLIKIKLGIFNIIKIAIGTLLMAIGIDLFLLPNQLSTGGFSGIGTILYYIFGFPIGTTVFVLNIPLFIIAYIKLGKKFFANAVIGTVLISVFLNAFQNIESITNDRFLAFLYGSIITGVGTAIVLKAEGSTGGTDLLASIVKFYKPQIKTGTMIVILDAIIVTANTIFFKETEVALYSALGIYVLGKILDIFFEGIDFSKMMFIISPKWEEISDRINKELKRGVTALEGQGMYKKTERKVLMCAMTRNEIRKARAIIKEMDPTAFIIITNAREVFGEGFKET